MERRTNHGRGWLLTLACGLAFGVGDAHAQNALGDGTALDGNLQTGSGGRNPDAVNFRRELAYRNAIVTGNVPGGFAFRGDVGYAAANDFRGATAADDIFNFQRDAFFSGLGTRGLSGLGPIQASLAYSVGGQSYGLIGDVIINRPYSGVDSFDVTAGTSPEQRIDVYGTIGGTLRSPGSITLQELDRPTFYQALPDASGQTVAYVGATDLLGVRPLPPDNSMFGGIDPAFEDDLLRRLREDPTLATPIGDEDPDTINPQRIPTHNQLLRALGVPTSTGDLIDDPTADPTEEPGNVPTGLDDPLDPVRRAFEESERRANPFNRVEDNALRQSESTAPTGDAPFAPAVPDQPTGDEPESGDEMTFEQRVDAAIEAAERVLGRPIELDGMQASRADDPVFTRHMDRGVDLLREERWFDAEERFAAALALAPGDPMASLGRVHAQLGAGMFLSAGTNLRRLYIGYPELIAARVDKAFMPGDKRLDEVRMLLRSRMDPITHISDECALLLAYIGRQASNQTDLDEGLRRLGALSLNAETGEADTLARVLIATWGDTPAVPDDEPAP